MKFAVINVQDPVGKTVGGRKLRDAWKYAMGMQKTANDLRRSFGHGGLCPKGVFRFKSHEEADQWMMEMLAKSARRSQT
ncbi:MAG: hypothetical protein ABI674_04690 [Spartobacteria bacterium]